MAKVAENLVTNIEDTEVLQIATTVKSLHTELGELENRFASSKADLVSKVKCLWQVETNDGDYPKNYKAETSLGIVQVEAKISSAKGTMEVAMRPTLEALFGTHTDSLFEEETVLNEVMDKRQVLMALLGPGINLNDIEITFKNPSLMEEIEKVGALTTKKVIVPKSKFLDLLDSIPAAVRVRAEWFLKKYLENAQSFVVVCGNRGKK